MVDMDPLDSQFHVSNMPFTFELRGVKNVRKKKVEESIYVFTIILQNL